MQRTPLTVSLLLSFGLAALTPALHADDYYVSATRGKGKKGTKEEPVRDLGIIAAKLKAGDTIYIAGGTYVGLSESGADEIGVPVRIFGGYDDTFTTRDPWGTTKTVLSGNNTAKNFSGKARLHVGNRRNKAGGEIVIDGIVVDNGARNGFMGEGALQICRRFQPKTGSNAAPDSPGISVDAQEGCKVTVTNCAVFNCAPTHKTGALKVFCAKDGMATIHNNLLVNNTGAGICCLSSFHPRDGKDIPQFTVSHNTVLFTWKFDALSTDSGSSLKLESSVVANVHHNVFAFSDAFGVDNAAKSKLTAMTQNLFCANSQTHYREFSTDIAVTGLDEEAQHIDDSAGNVEHNISVPAPSVWAAAWATRVVVDRQVAESEVKAKNNWQNDVRSMLNLPLQGTDLKLDTPVWLHRIDTDGALACGLASYQDGAGCQNPNASVPSKPTK